MQLNKNVKACPICGGQPEGKSYGGLRQMFTVECSKCGVTTPREMEVEYAVSDWNNNKFQNLEMRFL